MTEGNQALHVELDRVDPATAARIHPHDTKRLVRALEVWQQSGRPLSAWQREWGWHAGEARQRRTVVVGLERPVDELEGRMRERVRTMLASGWIEEAVKIRDGPGFGPTSCQALGYREVLAHVDGELDRFELEDRVFLRTRQFARRQGTWFRRFPARWIEAGKRGVVDALRSALGW